MRKYGLYALAGLSLVLGSLAVGFLLGGAKGDMEAVSFGKVQQKSAHQNRLRNARSPYLLQHADNPVDWYPWGEEAFERARQEDKPIFLSIGYSTCHWCHVMERESFEDPEVAALMNEVFVSIKVDREERPDIDGVYMKVCRMMSPSCGWPLNVIMTPDKRPFFVATYIPKETRYGRRGMLELVPAIGEMWRTRRGEILEAAERVSSTLAQFSTAPRGEEPAEPAVRTAYGQLAGSFDEKQGGFGRAPKFPAPHNLLFLLRYWKWSGEERALEMVEKTLREMRRGGIYDHVGFGFHRYSTDAEWLLPHFEKMLYDQAMLSMAYAEAYQATGGEEYRRTAEEIFEYVLRDMTSPEGAFYSAEDADSEGVEGKFYLWSMDDLRETLEPDEAGLLIKVFSVDGDGNFQDEASGSKTGANVLHLGKPLAELADDFGMDESEFRSRLERARVKLFAARERRVRPDRDDKVLTDWNGLMIAALAKGARAFGEPKYAAAAARAADFLLERMRDGEGRLLHRFRGGEAGIKAFADDYAFLIWGLLELYEATFEVDYLRTAIELNRDFMERYWDARDGGFFFTADDGEELLVRNKEIYDGALPSGNSVAMLNLLRLARMTGATDLEVQSSKLARAFSGIVNRAPVGHAQLMSALIFALGPSYEVVITGNPNADGTARMIAALRRQYAPNKVVLFKPSGEDHPLAKIAPFTQSQVSIGGKATAYVCSNFVCERPTTDVNKMLELVGATKRR